MGKVQIADATQLTIWDDENRLALTLQFDGMADRDEAKSMIEQALQLAQGVKKQ